MGAGMGNSMGASLQPRQPARPLRSGPRRVLAILIVAAVVLAVTALVVFLLGDATLFFYNADEAVERRAELGSERFRVQGTPLDGSITETFRDDQPVLAFSIGFEGSIVDVVHSGDPRELFQPGVPVVLEGNWTPGPAPVDSAGRGALLADDGWFFASDRMLVKHDNDYRDRADYDARVDQAEQGRAVP